ncbi:hypothetical protein SISNIDRAFT_546868 [Sistotremastrum niveocremeum HHB9708]|uniref:Uncharacterized protein n=1 Tax=Sistotremastrum niveocremeum HHB9708 TaxID=1314777 RepID=A0A164ZKX8_9AGAM|nr:hypothetical protein SISNIDRAFT_546868 [Sistotremastrum niveocremeum HHB9708]
MTDLINFPNRIVEKQKIAQASPNLIHLKLPRSRLYFNTYLTAFGVGVVGLGYGLVHLINGKPTAA